MKLRHLLENEDLGVPRQINEVTAKKWPTRLKDVDAIIDFIASISDFDEDEDMLLTLFDGMSADLKEVDISKLHRQKDVDLRGDEDDYADMPAETAPPILVLANGEIQDGAHRYEAAKIRGDKKILAYVLKSK